MSPVKLAIAAYILALEVTKTLNAVIKLVDGLEMPIEMAQK